MLACAAPLLITACGAPTDRAGLPTDPDREAVVAERHMVSAAHPAAVEAGLKVLRAGGSAMDAAVAVQMVLGLVEPAESGIGGGGFLLHYSAASGKVSFYDGREAAPGTAATDRFLVFGRPMPLWAAVPGGRAIGVPGLVSMLEIAHDDHGRLPWATLLAPATRLATDGVDMPGRLQRQLDTDRTLRMFGDMRRAFHRQARGESPRLVNLPLADTLDALAEQGPRAFYEGPIAEALVERARTPVLWPGDLTVDDLAAYEARRRDAVCADYRQWRICGAAPSSSGGIAVLQILGMLEHFDIAALDPGSATAAHLIAEAGRLAFADRARHVGDPDHVDVPIDALLDRGYLARRAALIDTDAAREHAPAGEPPAVADPDRARSPAPGRGRGTSHFSVVDADGDAVALTSSNEAPFGSRMMSGGFVLNNQLTDFDFAGDAEGRDGPNLIAPGKRPRSSMSPVLVFDADDELRLVLGSRGGSRIIGYVAHTLLAVLDWELDVQQAISLPRVLHRGAVLELEADTPAAELRSELMTRGHAVAVHALTSGLHGIEPAPGGGWRGGADPRLDGVAAGDD